VIYMAAQFAGGIIAAFAVNLLLGSSGDAGQTAGDLTRSNVWSAAVIEGILVFFLLTAIYQAAVYGKAGGNAALAIGLTLVALIAATGTLTGASVNPARTLGPVLVSGDYSYVVQYMIGLFAGGAVAGLVHGRLLKS
jgi:glycerol uptake facilitator-like aquaporin